MATKKELFAAVRLIKDHCKETSVADCAFDCPLRRWCRLAATNPEGWPGPAGHDSPICAVEFDEFTGGFNPFANYDCDCGVYIDASGCEVIGNIYDNQELLEEKE